MTTLISVLPYIQIILAILIVGCILIQRSENSAGGAFGGNDNWNNAYHSRRGFEKVIFNSAIVLIILFVISAILALFLK
ncbi:MAG: preprotein translocase subunit SecG [Candidatus Taylorbacteria bacterium]|nr:preprotein translocase subunit SecG [Candidatus Taylorbacteria bacterium]